MEAPLDSDDVTTLLRDRGALLEGHFRLTSGRHSDVYIEKFRLFEDPRLTASVGRAMASRFAGKFDVVASPAIGAVVVGFSTALAAETRFVFSERVDGRMTLRRGFAFAPGERTLVVEDVITTGGSTRELLGLVREAGGEPVGLAALVDRTSADPEFGVPFRPLARVESVSWAPDECPLCSEGVALADPKQV